MRKWIIATAVLLTIPMVGAAAVVYAPAEQEQLVEGHTVFTVITVRNGTAEKQEQFAAAVAVLVREQVRQIDYQDRFPGVLWFNDQYLVNPQNDRPTDVYPQFTRYPCGAVIAVNEGDPLPKVNSVPIVPSTAGYVETYHITDPNDQVWDVDKWIYDPDANATTTNSFLIWSVPTLGSTSGNYTTGDDGKRECSAVTSSEGTGCQIYNLPFTDDTMQPGQPVQRWNRSDVYEDNGAWEGRSSCLVRHSRDSGIDYNAVLYFFLDDLTKPGTVKDHRVTTGADRNDRDGCQVGYSAWPCPDNDDNKEGNSHPYNPRRPWPLQVSEGRGNHGGSTGCGGDEIGGGQQYFHATCNIDVYFGYVAATMPLPTERVYRVWDVEGRTAPYHCDPRITSPQLSGPCNEEEVAPGYL